MEFKQVSCKYVSRVFNAKQILSYLFNRKSFVSEHFLFQIISTSASSTSVLAIKETNLDYLEINIGEKLKDFDCVFNCTILLIVQSISQLKQPSFLQDRT